MRACIRQSLAILGTTGGRFLEDHGFLLASALAFTVVLCLAPLVLILFSIAGFLLASDEIAEYLYDSATLLFPAYGRQIAELLNALTRERQVSGLLGVGGLVVFATQLFSLTRTVINRAFRIQQRRGWLHGFAFDLVAVIVVGSLVVGVAAAMLVLVTLGDFALGLLPAALAPAVHLRRVLALPVLYATGMALAFLVYWRFPHTRVPAGAAAMATLVVTGLWEVARWAFGLYVAAFGVYGKLYGSFGIGMAALVWIYYSALIFIFGAELAAVVAERRSVGREAAASALPVAPTSLTTPEEGA